jgi:hypothetical protein
MVGITDDKRSQVADGASMSNPGVVVTSKPIFLLLSLGAFCVGASPAWASEQPDPQMIAAVERVARFIETGGKTSSSDIFATKGVTIIENFPPYQFSGTGAVESWARQMRAHLMGVTELRHRFGQAYDFSRVGDQAYFSLPTTWQGLDHGKPFIEEGGWAFVLEKQGNDWRVSGYGWAVTQSSEK